MKLTVNELFSGIGAQRKALERMGVSHEVVGICEIDKYAIQSYEAIFGPTYNYGDISKAPRLKYADLWTYSFPCQDISVAGNQKGINENTRSGLLYEVQRLLEVAEEEETLPKYLLLENVKNLVGKNFKAQFDEWLSFLDELGYNNYWQVLNSKDYGIPQNRERVFVMSIRKDIDNGYTFPTKEPLGLCLADILEDTVEEKYYILPEKAQNFLKTLEDKEICNSIRVGGRGSLDRHSWDLVWIAASRGRNPDNPSDRTVGAPTEQRLELNTQGISNTITTVQKDNYVVGMFNPYNNAKVEDVAPTQTTACGITTSSATVLIAEAKIQQNKGNSYPNLGNPQAGRVYKAEGISPALDTCQGGNRMPKILSEDISIRKLTPLECWRLMGFDDEDFNKAQSSGVSDTQLYKQAGNSIVVNVLEKIFTELLFREMI